MLTPIQIEELHAIVDKYSVALVAKAVGTKTLSKKDIKLLEKSGFRVPTTYMTPTQAFKFGLIASKLKEAQRKGLKYEAIRESLVNPKYLPFTLKEKLTIDYLDKQLAEGIKMIGDRVKADISRELVKVEGELLAHSPIVIDSVKKVVENRTGIWQAISEIGKFAHKEGKWTRDIGRIANYVLHSSYNHGHLSGIERENPTARVYFDVYPQACKHCIRLYLTGGLGSEPITFTIQEIRNNGSNIGLPVKDWKASLSGAHPNCRCSVNDVPYGYIWSEEKRAFTTPDPDWKPSTNSKLKIKITITET